MHEGTISIVRDDKSPFQSPNTRLVASARAVGFNWGNDAPFMDAFEEVEGEEKLKRTVTWCMDGDQKVEFIWATRDDDGKLHAHEEEIRFDTFRARYIDLDWVRANPDHPIAYLRGTHWHHGKMLKAIKSLPKQQIVRRGGRVATIPVDMPEDKRRKLLKILG